MSERKGDIALGMFIGFIIGIILCTTLDVWQWHRRAVQNGHAHYKLTNEFGGTEWEWLPACDGKPHLKED